METLTPTLAAAYAAHTQYPIELVEVVPRGANSATPALATLDVQGGTTDLDTTRPVRRSLGSLAVPIGGANADLLELLDLTAPYELRLRYGRDTSWPVAETPEYNACGVYGYDKPARTTDAKGERVLMLSGQDRMQKLSSLRWTDPFTVQKNTLIPAAMRAIVGNRWPRSAIPLEFDFSACVGHPIMEMTTPTYIFGSDNTVTDPTQDLISLAAAGGCECSFNGEGRLAVNPWVSPDTAPVVAWYDEESNARIVSVQDQGDLSRTYNGVVVTGGNSSDPVNRAEWWDTDPSSPTNIDIFGKVPAFYDSPLIRSVGQAYVVAQAFGHRLRMGGYVLTLNTVSNGAYEGSDALSVVSDEADLTGVYLLEKFNLGLGPSATAMQIVSRLTNQLIGVSIT